MADNDAYLRLRRMTGEDDETSKYTNVDLDIFITDAGGDLQAAAAAIWAEKAGSYADLVNTSEAGSRRDNSDLFKHAIDRQAYYESKSGVGIVSVQSSSTTRRIVRA